MQDVWLTFSIFPEKFFPLTLQKYNLVPTKTVLSTALIPIVFQFFCSTKCFVSFQRISDRILFEFNSKPEFGDKAIMEASPEAFSH